MMDLAAPDTVWYTRCPVPAAFGVEVARGVAERELTREGVALRSLSESSDPAVRGEHFDHRGPAVLRQGGNVPPLVAASRGADIRIIGLSWYRQTEPLLVLPGSPIRTVADLRGRRLSIPVRAGNSIDFWRTKALRGFEHALAGADLTLDDVTLVEVPIARSDVEVSTERSADRAQLWDAAFILGFQREEAVALVRGEVDAIYSAASVATVTRGFLGLRTVVELGWENPAARVGSTVPVVFTVSGALLDGFPEVVDRIVARTLETVGWAAEHPAEAKRMIAREVGLAEDLLDATFGATINAELDFDLAPDKLAALERQRDFLSVIGALAGPVELDRLVDDGPLRRSPAAAAV